jgi:hypothetical protein
MMIQFMFLNSVHVGFLFALVSANLNDLVFDGRHGDMVVILGCQSGRFRGFWYGHGVAAVFVDSGEIGMVKLYMCVGEKRKECALAGLVGGVLVGSVFCGGVVAETTLLAVR